VAIRIVDLGHQDDAQNRMILEHEYRFLQALDGERSDL